jgi:hypothetical protein
MTTSLDEQKAAARKIVAKFDMGDLTEAEALFSAAYVDHQKPTWLDDAGI